jgi:hypothetical protein
MPSQKCPTIGCGWWTANKPQKWTKLDPLTFSLEFDEERRALNGKVCQECQNIHTGKGTSLGNRRRRLLPAQPVARDLLDELTAAADEQPLTPPPPHSPPPSPPQSLPPPSLPPTRQQLAGDSPATSTPAVRRALSDITNHTSPRRHNTPLKRKQQILRAVSNAVTPQERAAANTAGCVRQLRLR